MFQTASEVGGARDQMRSSSGWYLKVGTAEVVYNVPTHRMNAKVVGSFEDRVRTAAYNE